MSKFKTNLLSILSILFILHPFLQSRISLFSYFDEFVMVILFVAYLLRVIKMGKIYSFDGLILSLLVLLLAVGLLGNYLSEYDIVLESIITDVVNISKVFLIFISTLRLFNEINIKQYFNYTVWFVKVFLAVGLIFGILNQFVSLGMNYDFRYGLKSFMYIYEHPMVYLSILMCVFGLLFLYEFYTHKRQRMWLIVTLILMISTLRAKAFAFAVVFIMLYFVLIYLKHKVSIITLVLIGIVAIIVGYPQIENYFLGDMITSPRALLYTYGIRIFQDKFPIGYGLGTYGSFGSALFYSPIYYRYGLNEFWVLSPSNRVYLTDSFWPMIIGQFGFIGTIIFVLILAEIIKFLFQRVKDRKLLVLGLSIYLFMFIGSFIDSSYTHYTGSSIFFYFAIFFIIVERHNMNKKIDKTGII